MHTSTRTLLRRRQEQLAVKSTLSLTKKSVPELNDQPSYICLGTAVLTCNQYRDVVVVVVVVDVDVYDDDADYSVFVFL